MTIIVIGGPDGCGKSTVSSLLRARMPVTRVEHYRPAPPISDPARQVTNPHDAPHRGYLVSLAKLWLLFAEQLLAVPGREKASRAGLVLIERGWWDALVDPQRYRLHPRATRWVRVLGTLLPRADYAIVLTADAGLIYARKPEISKVEIMRQLKAWPAVAARAGRTCVAIPTDDIDTTTIRVEALARELGF